MHSDSRAAAGRERAGGALRAVSDGQLFRKRDAERTAGLHILVLRGQRGDKLRGGRGVFDGKQRLRGMRRADSAGGGGALRFRMFGGEGGGRRRLHSRVRRRTNKGDAGRPDRMLSRRRHRPGHRVRRRGMGGRHSGRRLRAGVVLAAFAPVITTTPEAAVPPAGPPTDAGFTASSPPPPLAWKHSARL